MEIRTMLTRAAVAVLLTHCITGTLVAQEITAADRPASEFGRGSGGQIEAVTKPAVGKFSGSLGVVASQSSLSSSARPGYEATLGGTVVDDRVWFFAAAAALPQMTIGQPGNATAVDAKLMAQIGDRNNLAASFSQQRDFAASTPALDLRLPPSNFLSLRYTSVVSNNLFFSASFNRHSATEREPAFPFEQPR